MNKETCIINKVPDECFLKIFMDFNLTDLFNASLACSRFIPAAHGIYKKKFGQKTVTINECNETFKKGQEFVSEFATINHIYGRLLSLQYIRCFGAVIRKLAINYEVENNENYEVLHDYINEYCVNIEEISINWLEKDVVPRFFHGKFKKNVRLFINSNLSDTQLRDLLRSFPDCIVN